MKRMDCLLVGSLALSVAATACSKQSSSEAPEATQGAVGAEARQTFQFVPVNRSFTQTTVQTKTISSPGSSLRTEVTGEYLWNVSAMPDAGSNANYLAQLRRVILRVDGQEVANQVPLANQVKVRVDGKGNLVDVSGTETLAQGLLSSMPPERQEASRSVIEQAAESVLTERFQLTVADLQGRPTALGSSWTVRSQADGPVRGKTWTVRAQEVCGREQCLRVESTYDIDSEGITSRLEEALAGQDTGPGGLELSDVTVSAKDSILVEPDTLFLHQARFEQDAQVMVEREGQRQPMVIQETRELKVQAPR